MAAAGVGDPERDRPHGSPLAAILADRRKFSAANICRIVASLPTAADSAEATAKAALEKYGLARPVFDGASGVRLDPRRVFEARQEELTEVHKHKVWKRVP